ncbi:hypothetical protein BGZ82_003276 [Podila clonocystis]|nr:hypothetical protein BGZ82_003276 [Podila clonocystis]
MGQAPSQAVTGYRIAPEWERHQSTIMSWPTGWEGLNYNVQSDIARVAQAVSKFEYVQVLVPPSHVKQAKEMLGNGIDIIPMQVNDLWARDTVPLFLNKGKDLVGVDYNFNGWGRKQPYNIVNKNRNPGKSRDQIEQIFKSELGVQKVIWVKGVTGHDITDSHIDSLARFVAPGVVMVSRPAPAPANDKESQVWIQQYKQALTVLNNSTDAKGRKLKIIELPEPDPAKVRKLPSRDITSCKDIDLDCENGGLTSYVNFYITNGGIVMPQFGDKAADSKAVDIVQKAFPDRKVVAVSIDYVAVGGGGIHCATHEVPRV